MKILDSRIGKNLLLHSPKSHTLSVAQSISAAVAPESPVAVESGFALFAVLLVLAAPSCLRSQQGSLGILQAVAGIERSRCRDRLLRPPCRSFRVSSGVRGVPTA